MADIQLNVQARYKTGKGANRKIKKTGFVPAILYGKGKSNLLLSLEPTSLKKALTAGGGINTLLHLNIQQDEKKSTSRTALVKEIQKNPLTRQYEHVDFYEIDLTKKIMVGVPLHFVGKAEGAKEGGILQQTIREIRVKCFPNKIPSHIAVDISHLKVGDSLHIADIKTAEDYEIIYEHNEAIASLIVPKEEVVQPVAAAPAEGEAQAAPATPGAEAKGEGAKEEAPTKKETSKKEEKEKK